MWAIVYSHMQMRNSQTYLLGISQNQMPRGSTLVNLATDCKIVMQQWAWFYAVCFSAPNRFGLELYDIINYNDVLSATDSLELVKDVRFTDV